MANNEDLDEMAHKAVFHQGLHCLLRQNRSSEKEMQLFLEVIICNPSIYTMDNPDFTVSNFMENSNGLKMVYHNIYLFVRPFCGHW